MGILGIYASQITGHLVTNSYESIATVTVGSGGSSSISFSSITSDYKHLQVRGNVRTTSGVNNIDLLIRMNSDSGSSYSLHSVRGDGSNPSGENATGQTSMWLNRALPADANIFGGIVVDVLDYASVNKYKTIRGISGQDRNGSGQVSLNSGLWFSTTAMNSLTFTCGSGNFAEFSQIALYGIKV